MRRKGPRAIPDFSRQAARPTGERTTPAGSKPDAPAPRAAAPAPHPAIKPHATSAKSGRRGQ